MEPADTAENASPRVTAIVTTSRGVSNTVRLSPESDLMQVETEVREGFLQDTFIELDILVDGARASAFINPRHTVSIIVMETPDA